jgi:hypothetical protein
MLTRGSRSSRSSTRAGGGRGTPHQLLSVLSLGIPLALLAQSLVSCGSDDDGQACEPGEIRACALAGSQCEAVQVCSSDGAGYGDCACPGMGSAGSAGAGSGGSGGGSNGGAAGAGGAEVDPLFEPGERAIGAPCTSDAQCPTGPAGEAPLFCITAGSTEQFTTGGPQGGYCSAACDSNADCTALDGLSACSRAGYCIGLCQPGAADTAIKCFEERAQACIENPNTPDLGACLPICQSDAGCGAGLFCDLGRGGLGLCSATAPTGGDVGAPCAEETQATDCKSGLCLSFQDGSGSFCSANCTFGALAGCGFAEEISVPREAVCAQTQLEDGGNGDIGFCLELCDTAADCAQVGAGWICSDDLTDQGKQLVGREGICQPPGVGTPIGGDAGAP